MPSALLLPLLLVKQLTPFAAFVVVHVKRKLNVFSEHRRVDFFDKLLFVSLFSSFAN
jgi:hypothetical protein